jgi:hypothetical protein
MTPTAPNYPAAPSYQLTNERAQAADDRRQTCNHEYQTNRVRAVCVKCHSWHFLGRP